MIEDLGAVPGGTLAPIRNGNHSAPLEKANYDLPGHDKENLMIAWRSQGVHQAHTEQVAPEPDCGIQVAGNEGPACEIPAPSRRHTSANATGYSIQSLHAVRLPQTLASIKEALA